MTDLTNILLGLGVLGLAIAICAVPLAAKLLSSMKTIQQALVPQPPAAERRELGPQPFEVKQHDRPVTQGELLRVERNVDKLEDSLEKLSASIVANGEKRKADIEAKVKESRDEAQRNFSTLNREVGGLKTAVELNTTHLSRIEEKLDRR